MDEGAVAGYPIVDVRVVLTDGSSHSVDSSGQSFEIAGSMAMKKGVMDASPALLEPIMRLDIEAPEQFAGAVVSDLNTRRAHISAMTPAGGVAHIEAEAPQSEAQQYSTHLRALTQGRGTLSMRFRALRRGAAPSHSEDRGGSASARSGGQSLTPGPAGRSSSAAADCGGPALPPFYAGFGRTRTGQPKKEFVMRGVILAAGDGGRLRPYPYRTPKALIRLRERPLIWYPLAAMAEAGIREIGVVVGHQGGAPRRGTARLDALRRPGWSSSTTRSTTAGNAVSVRAARAFAAGQPFMLAMGDHVIEPGVASRLAEDCGHPAVLGVDSAARMESQLSDATKALVDEDGYLRRIGKELRRWNAVDIGVFVFQPTLFDDLDHLYDLEGPGLELNRVMQYLANRPGGVATRDVQGLFWSDIDTVEDYRSADEHIRSDPGIPL